MGLGVVAERGGDRLNFWAQVDKSPFDFVGSNALIDWRHMIDLQGRSLRSGALMNQRARSWWCMVNTLSCKASDCMWKKIKNKVWDLGIKAMSLCIFPHASRPTLLACSFVHGTTNKDYIEKNKLTYAKRANFLMGQSGGATPPFFFLPPLAKVQDFYLRFSGRRYNPVIFQNSLHAW